MNKNDLVRKIQTTVGSGSLKDIDAITSALFNAIQESVVNGEKVVIVGFGTFEPSLRAARNGRNPQNGEVIVIPETNSCHFKIGKNFKDALNTK